jgi:hypothetical protein
MPFYYGVEQSPATPYATHATPNTEDPTMVLRQTTRNCDILSITAGGRAAAATTISGIGYKVRRWTTVGTGGTTVTPAPRRIGTTASTVIVDKASAITAGTVSGAFQLGFVCGKAGPGGWVARNEDAAVNLEAGSADEIDINSVAGEASLLHTVGCEISE